MNIYAHRDISEEIKVVGFYRWWFFVSNQCDLNSSQIVACVCVCAVQQNTLLGTIGKSLLRLMEIFEKDIYTEIIFYLYY